MEKLGVVSSLVFCAFSAVIGGSYSYIPTAGVSLLTPQDLIGIENVLTDRSIVRRQTLAEYTQQDVIDCTAVVLEHQCDSSSFAQQIIDIALNCGNETVASSVVNNCARNENGDFCGVATLKFSSNVDEAELLNGATACSEAITTGICPLECSNFLRSAKTKLGCCLGMFNATDSFFSPLLGYQLWNLCNVQVPPAICENQLIVTNLSVWHRTVHGRAVDCSHKSAPVHVDRRSTTHRCPVTKQQMSHIGRTHGRYMWKKCQWPTMCWYSHHRSPRKCFEQRDACILGKQLQFRCNLQFYMSECCEWCQRHLWMLCEHLQQLWHWSADSITVLWYLGGMRSRQSWIL